MRISIAPKSTSIRITDSLWTLRCIVLHQRYTFIYTSILCKMQFNVRDIYAQCTQFKCVHLHAVGLCTGFSVGLRKVWRFFSQPTYFLFINTPCIHKMYAVSSECVCVYVFVLLCQEKRSAQQS